MPFKLPSAPKGSIIYAIGDIHGRVDTLAKLLKIIRHDVAHQDKDRWVLIFLGDYVDRGPKSRQVVDLLLSEPMPGFEKVFLKGNHEAWMLAYLDDASVGEHWFAAGGGATLLSYGIAFSPGATDPEHARKAFSTNLPETHQSFLAGLSMIHTEGDYAFTHAGIRPGVALEEQQEEDLLWGSEDFIRDERDHGKVIVHGHWLDFEPVVCHNRIGIDTGAFATGRLTCLVLADSEQRFLFT